MTILSVNPIDMQGRVRTDAEKFELPYTVLSGRDSDIISLYKIGKLPRIMIIQIDSTIAFAQKFASYDKLKEELERILKTNP